MSELLAVQLLDPGAVAPERAHAGDAGVDLRLLSEVVLAPGERARVRTGIAVAIPVGHAGLVVLVQGSLIGGALDRDTPGTIDAGYAASCSSCC